VTNEPALGPSTKRTKQLAYLIQKHAATRLHYDFRLELDGILLSWAVTKGPSLNPADKRLAVRTEDHPVSYGDFEGTIPKGQYGGGTVMLWDRGTWTPKGDPHEGLAKGHLGFVLHGEKLKGNWDLIRMRGDNKRENWLLVKSRDAEARRDSSESRVIDNLNLSVKSGRSMDAIAAGEAAAKSKTSTRKLETLMKTFPNVELATLVDTPPEGDDWVHEFKFDGYRLLGFLSSGDVRLRTRNGQDWTDKFPAIVNALTKLKANSAVVDMEAVVLDEAGKSNFQALQAALGVGGQRESIVGYAFDLIYFEDRDISSDSLVERKKILKKLLEKSKTGDELRYSEHIVGGGGEVLSRSCRLGLEGIVSKKADAPYSATRGKSWLKTKCTKRQEFVIVGYSDAKKGSRALGALYLGYYQGRALHYAGKVGTGFTLASARELIKGFASLKTDDAVLTRVEMEDVAAAEFHAIHWLSPKLLCEVAFSEWTSDGRIRHPSFQGLRQDKEARDVKMEKPISVGKPQGTLELAGVKITHPDRVISETDHITKGQLAEYYALGAPAMLTHIARHPVSLLRCPSGIANPCFYQRNPGVGLGPEVHSFKFHGKNKTYEYLYIEDETGLLSLIQMGATEIHPWGASINAIDFPDRMIFDLDPSPEIHFEAVKLAAQDLRQRLKDKGLESMPKCTGGKGIHVIVPLAAKDKWAEVKAFAANLANEMVEATPSAYIATMSKAKRKGKIFIDYFRNDYTATAIADYSVRAREGAPVAVPVEWKELKNIKSASQFTIADVAKRLKTKQLPAWPKPQRIPE
jgi:bifunctional non-homologous end joining protein LigD